MSEQKTEKENICKEAWNWVKEHKTGIKLTIVGGFAMFCYGFCKGLETSQEMNLRYGLIPAQGEPEHENNEINPEDVDDPELLDLIEIENSETKIES